MDYNSLLTNTNIIIENLNLLDSNITQLKKKVSSINKVYQKLLGNKIKSYTAKRWMATERKLKRR